VTLKRVSVVDEIRTLWLKEMDGQGDILVSEELFWLWTLDLLGCRPSLPLGPVKVDFVLLDGGQFSSDYASGLGSVGHVFPNRPLRSH
jgi:hypothetical protein